MYRTTPIQVPTVLLCEPLQNHDLVESACRRALAESVHLHDVLARDPTVTAQLAPDALDRLFAPESYLGMAERFVQRVLAARKPRSGLAQTNDSTERREARHYRTYRHCRHNCG